MLRRFESHAPRLAAGAWVDEMALVIGDVTLGEGASVWPLSVLRGDVNHIRVGARTNVQDGTVIHVSHAREGVSPGLPTLIGADVTIGHRAIIHACTIGNACLIGMGAIVMDGAVLGDESMLAAGSVVPPGKRLEGGWLYVGSPAQPRRRLLDAERENLYYSAAHYVSLVLRHLAVPEQALPPGAGCEGAG